MKSFTRIKKINGQEYLYEITPYYDKEKKKIARRASTLARMLMEFRSRSALKTKYRRKFCHMANSCR